MVFGVLQSCFGMSAYPLPLMCQQCMAATAAQKRTFEDVDDGEEAGSALCDNPRENWAAAIRNEGATPPLLLMRLQCAEAAIARLERALADLTFGK